MGRLPKMLNVRGVAQYPSDTWKLQIWVSFSPVSFPGLPCTDGIWALPPGPPSPDRFPTVPEPGSPCLRDSSRAQQHKCLKHWSFRVFRQEHSYKWFKKGNILAQELKRCGAEVASGMARSRGLCLSLLSLFFIQALPRGWFLGARWPLDASESFI